MNPGVNPEVSDGALAGFGILVTRPADQATELVAAIENAGGKAVRFPVIEITGRDKGVVADEFAALPAPDLIIFVSQNAARFGGDICASAQAEIGAIGPSTQAALAARGIVVGMAPEGGFTSEHFLDHPSLSDVAGKNVVIVRGESGRELLGDELQRRGAVVGYLSAYRRQIVRPSSSIVARIDELWRQGGINFVTVLSVETLENLLQLLLPTSIDMLRNTPLVAPGGRVIQTAMRLVPDLQAYAASGPAPGEILAALIEVRNSGQG
ncbi:MAG: uroporphyrinogen-III synthase [Woeseiaceae bacterium]